MNPNRPPLRQARITRNVVALGIVSLFTDAATEMIYPLVPVFITLLGSTPLMLGIIEGVAETTASMIKLAGGIISDKIGKRKPLVILGYGISTLVRPFTGAVSSAWQIVFVRMADRIGKGVRTAPRDALIAASTDDRIRGRAYGFHRAMDHAGAVIGPLLTLLVLVLLVQVFRMRDTVSIIRWTFYLAIIPGMLAMGALVFFVREQAVPKRSEKRPSFTLKQFDRNFLLYLGLVTLFTLGNSSDAFLLLRAQDALRHSRTLVNFITSTPVIGDMLSHFGDAEARQKLMDLLFIPMVWGFFHIIKVLFSTRLGALSDKIGRKIVINIGWGIYAFVYFSFAMLDRLPGDTQMAATLILFGIYAFYHAFSEGAEKAFVADAVKPHQHATAFGLYNFAKGLASLPASIIFGMLYKTHGPMVAFGTGAVIACLSMLLLMLVRERPG